MTVGTFRSRLDMGSRLALSLGAVVAAGAGTQNVGMIDCTHRRPGAGGVAILADVVGRDMVGGLASCRRSIVARGAIAADSGVAEARPGPCLGGVAGCAIIRGGNMPRAFAGGL